MADQVHQKGSKRKNAAVAEPAPRKSKSNRTVDEPSPVVAMAGVVTPEPSDDFVRGRVKHAPSERSSGIAERSNDADVLFGNTETPKKRSKTPNGSLNKRKAGVDVNRDATSPVKKQRTSDDVKTPRSSGAASSVPKRVEILSYKKLKVGMIMLGTVTGLNKLDLTVSLPCGLTGFVVLREVSDVVGALVDAFIARDDEKKDAAAGSEAEDTQLPALGSMFRVGQLVRVVVADLAKQRNKNHIELSMRASLVNRAFTVDKITAGLLMFGCVKSIEEKGYVIDYGLPDFTGFLPFDRVDENMLPQPKSSTKKVESASEDSVEQPPRLTVGQPVETVVVSVKGRIAKVTAKHADVSKAIVRSKPSASSDAPTEDKAVTNGAAGHMLTFGQIKPGMLVQCTVQSVLDNGLYVSFMTLFHATVDVNHLPELAQGTSWAEKYSVGQTLKGRVLHIDYDNKHVGISCKPNVVRWNPLKFPSWIQEGSIIERAEVLRVDQALGLSLSLKPGDGSAEQKDDDIVIGYAHISAISDTHLEKLSAKFKEGTIHRARVLSFSQMDGVANVSLQASVLALPVLSVNDVRPGQVVKGQVALLKEFGMLVRVAPKIKALCPTMHLADVPLQNPERLFVVDKEVSCRVLTVDAAKKKVVVTHKKTLVTSKLPCIADYADAKEGVVGHGFVSSAKDYGCIVEFYNSVHGLVPVEDMRRSGYEQHPSECFTVGQVVKVRVVSCNPTKQKLQLSFSLQAPEKVAPDSESKSSKKKSKSKGGDANLSDLTAAELVAVLRTAAPGRSVVTGTYCPKPDAVASAAPATSDEVNADTVDGNALYVQIELEVTHPKSNEQVRHRAIGVVTPSHLSDHVTYTDALQNCFAAEVAMLHSAETTDEQKELLRSRLTRSFVVLQCDKKGLLHLSAKPALLRVASGTSSTAALLPTSFDEVSTDSLVVGYVRSIADFGVFVGLPSFVSSSGAHVSVNGLCPRTLLADQFVSQPKDYFKLGQTVYARVTEIDAEKKRLIVALKPSMVETDMATRHQHYAYYLTAALADKAFLESHEQLFVTAGKIAAGSLPAQWSWNEQHMAGNVVTAQVDIVKTEVLTLKFDVDASLSESKGSSKASKKSKKPKPSAVDQSDAVPDHKGVVGLVLRTPHAVPDHVYTAGEVVQARILDTDKQKNIIDASLQPELVNAAQSAAQTETLAGLKIGDEVPVTIQLYKAPYFILSLPSHSHVIGYAAALSPNLPIPPPGVFDAGQQLTAKIMYVPVTASDSASSKKKKKSKGAPDQDSSSAPTASLDLTLDRKHGWTGDCLVLSVDIRSVVAASREARPAGSAQKQHRPRNLPVEKSVGFFDESISSWEDMVPGRVVTGKVHRLTSHHVVVAFSAKSIWTHEGLVHISCIADFAQNAAAKKKKLKGAAADAVTADDTSLFPLELFRPKIGEMCKFKVVEMRETKGTNKRTNEAYARDVYMLTATPSELAKPNVAPKPWLTAASVQVGDVVDAYVENVLEGTFRSSVWLVVSPVLKGHMASSESSTDSKQSKYLKHNFKDGQHVRAVVLSVNAERSVVELSVKRLGLSREELLAGLKQSARTEGDVKVARVTPDTIAPGQIVRARIRKLIPGIGLSVALGRGFFGRVHITDISDRARKLPLRGFQIGQQVKAYVLAVQREPLEATAADDDVSDSSDSEDDSKKQKVKRRKVAEVVVEDEGEDGQSTKSPARRERVIVDLSLRPSRLAKAAPDTDSKIDTDQQPEHASGSDDDEDDDDDKQDEAGAAGAASDVLQEVTDWSDLREGAVVKCYVKQASPKSGVFVWLNRDIVGRILLSQLADRFVKHVEKEFPLGKRVTCRVVSVDQETKHVDLSAKPSVLDPTKKPKTLLTLQDLAALVGTKHVLKGKIRKVEKFGVFVAINKSKTLSGLAHISDISDSFIDDVSKYYKIGDKVRAVVLKVDLVKKRINLGLKASLLAKAEQDAPADMDTQDADGAAIDEDDDETGAGDDGDSDGVADMDADAPDQASDDEKVDDGSDEADDMPVDSDSDDEVEELLNQMRGKPSNRSVKSADKTAVNAATTVRAVNESDSDDDQTPAQRKKANQSDSDSDSDDDHQSGDRKTTAAAATSKVGKQVDLAALVPALQVPTLQVNAAATVAGGKRKRGDTDHAANGAGLKVADSSDDEADAAGAESDAEDDDDSAKKQKSRKAKAAAKKREEKHVEEQEEALLDASRLPNSAADFERLILSSPQSSYLWVKYVEFLVGLTEIDRARAVIERALQSISFREEQEKWNIWVALLNLENLFGTNDTLAKVFERALKYNEPEKVYLEMAKIYENSEKQELASKTFETMARRFHTSPAVWTAYAAFKFRQGQADQVHTILQKALQGVPKTEHIALICKFALMEYKLTGGSIERGRTMLEGILTNYPKRVDIWSQYLDMEIHVARRLSGKAKHKPDDGASLEPLRSLKDHNAAYIRRVFERTIHLSLSSKKMKFFFDRYLQYEKEFGSVETVQHVKDAAREFVQSKIAE